MSRFLKTVSLIIISFILMIPLLLADKEEIISMNNEFGGETLEIIRDDFSIELHYFDDEGAKHKEEVIFTADYPIDNNLQKTISYFQSEKKTREERIYTSSFANRTLIEKSIIYFDWSKGVKIKEENHFIPPFSSYNVIFSKNKKKTKIEWHYPNNIDGIKTNIIFFDQNEVAYMTESYFTEKTTRELGHYKRIYYTSFNKNRYLRKNKQEWYFTPDYIEKNNGIAKKVEHFHYLPGQPVRIETLYFDQNDEYIPQ